MTNLHQVRFSIVIACRNEKNNIPSCINSIIAQSYKDYEIIVIDGASTDGTKEYLDAQKKHFAFFVSEPDNGVYDAWNKGLKKISGNWVYFLGADDELMDTSTLQKISLLIYQKNLYNADLICGSIYLKRRSKLIIPDIDRFPGTMPPHQGMFHASRLFDVEKPFNLSYKMRSDYDFLIGKYRESPLKIHSIEVIVANCQGGMSLSYQWRINAFLETWLIYKSHNINPYSIDMLNYLTKAIIMYLIYAAKTLSAQIKSFLLYLISLFSHLLLKKRGVGKLNLSTGKRTILWNCKIDLQGKNTNIRIGKNCILKNVNFIIKGDNAGIDIGDSVRIQGGDMWLEDMDSQIQIGTNTFIDSAHLAATEGKAIIIGNECMLANDIDIRTGDSHSILDITTGERVNYARDVILKSHVWVGAHSIILKGSIVNENTVIGTASLVTATEYPANCIIGGIPAKVIKENIQWIKNKL